MQTEIQALEVFEKGLSKSEIKSMAQMAVESVMEKGNPLEAAEGLTAMENFIKEVKASEQFKEYVREECTKHKGGFVSPSGAKIELAETGTKYDYSQCNDQLLSDLESVFENAKSKLDERQKFLKTVPIEGMDIITHEGEGVRIFPPSKSSTSSYKITLSR